MAFSNQLTYRHSRVEPSSRKACPKMSSYRRNEIVYESVECWKCKKVGHPAKLCTQLSRKEELYEIDRIDPGDHLTHFDNVCVTTPGNKCDKCEFKYKSHCDYYCERSLKEHCNCTKPIEKFYHLNVDGQFLDNITNETCCNFVNPTPIQRYALPIIDQGHDVMGCTPTGTGKTAAYLIPIVKFIQDQGCRKNSVGRKTPQRPDVLILAPTKELAMQIGKAAMKLTNDLKIRCRVCTVFGGVGSRKREQCDDIRRGCNILVGTTGRVRQILEGEDYILSLENIKILVLDEADKMLDMGFKSDIDLILDARKTDMTSTKLRQNLLFSATFRLDIQELAREYLKENHRLIVVKRRIGAPQKYVSQNFMLVEDPKQKLPLLQETLLDLLKTGEETFMEHKCFKTKQVNNEKTVHPNFRDFILHILGACSDKKIIIFVETEKVANKIVESVAGFLYAQFRGRFWKKFHNLYQYGSGEKVSDNFGVILMSGELHQSERVKNLNAFKDGVYPIMVSTSVIARGIDIEGVTHVINYDLPQDLYQVPRIKEHDDQAVREGKVRPERNQFEEYIHRIGRTGRAGKTGTAISFFEKDKDRKIAISLVEMLEKANSLVPEWLQGIEYEEKRKDRSKMGGRYCKGNIMPIANKAVRHEDCGPGPDELWGIS